MRQNSYYVGLFSYYLNIDFDKGLQACFFNKNLKMPLFIKLKRDL